jgi:hypothetical protein
MLNQSKRKKRKEKKPNNLSPFPILSYLYPYPYLMHCIAWNHTTLEDEDKNTQKHTVP